MRILQLLIAVFSFPTILAACAALGLEDNSTHMAFALERGARQLRDSTQSQLIVHYQPLDDLAEPYEVTFEPSKEVVRVDSFGNTLNLGGGYLVVTGKHGGGTNHHERFVFTPRKLHMAKMRGPTDVVLRKVGDRIDVVELR